jgi:hypothetical protein
VRSPGPTANAVCRALWGYSLDDFTDDDLSPNDHAWLDSLTQERTFDFAARHGYDLKNYIHGGWVSDWIYLDDLGRGAGSADAQRTGLPRGASTM